ncbi:hypothetical protein INS49_014272 [Diaporthe citri]|uniref:uncharacterized protein n=1 Tax=Diaporthe citri TaxID=83186 RepID=UPI001C8168C4|nr:uncharacterized protein INS49_014272 [Diaporthe citri]KAG6358388.1 hypothetical protein INS49_014272 [Diaporthe citri]
MSTPTELLEKKIRRREAVLRAREAETAAREAELEDLKESLQKLQSARNGIRDAIEDALSNKPTTIAPTDVLEMAVEGNTDTDPFANGDITAEEAIKLALISMRKDLGRRGLVKMIIQAAVQASQLDAEGVIKAALETVRSCDLDTSDVVRAALQASRNVNHIFVSDIIPPAVGTAMERGIEAPVVVKEAFVSAVRGDPSMVRTSVLSVLGCAMGMGMNYRDIKSIIKAFSKEIKLGEATEVRQSIAANAASPSKVVRFQSPPQPQNANQTPSQEPQKSQNPQEPEKPQSSNKKSGNGDNVDSSVVQAMVEAALESIDSGGPGMRALGDPFMMVAQWPGEYSAAYEAVQEVLAERTRAKGKSSKRSEAYSDDDQPQGPASKKVKLNYRGEDHRDKGQ